MVDMDNIDSFGGSSKSYGVAESSSPSGVPWSQSRGINPATVYRYPLEVVWSQRVAMSAKMKRAPTMGGVYPSKSAAAVA